uniref:AAA+ ATPase domain-containing protein n=1 Tax=Globisporangium ultimum (strain ATCC 200006 / CBS 805.95 / DAOM BR144) TaxID=431595 RepID=K3XBC1_GLOUD
MSKYFGDSEKAVRQLFARARAASPCILFFDEFDAIAHKRSFSNGDGDGGGDSGGDSVYARILSTFLNEMDGVGATTNSKSASSSSGEILVIAATNRIDALDAALIRPGRIDKMIEIGFPTETDKEAILTHYTRKMPLDADVVISILATRPTGNRPFTGADLGAVCKDAAFRALREDLDANVISMRHFEDAWCNRIQNPLEIS